MLFLGISGILESLSRNARVLDGLQRNINYLLQDRERLVLDLRNVAEAIRIEGQEGLRGLFGGDQRVEQFFELATLAEAPLHRSPFHRDFPADEGFSYDPPQAGPSGTEHEDPLPGGPSEVQREEPPPPSEAHHGVPPLPFPEIDASGNIFGPAAAAGTMVEQEPSGKVAVSGDEPLLSFTP